MVNTLQKYLIKELLRTFIPALLCFELLVLLGFSVQLIHKGLDVPSLAYIMPYISLYALPYALPASLLTATVMTYGRLSADNEIMAIKISGLHLHNVITPIIIAGVLFSLITLYLNAEVLPKSYFKVRSLQEKAVKQVLAKHFITAKKKINFNPYQIYISSVEDGVYKDIAVFEYAGDYIISVLLSEEGEIEINEAGNLASLTLRRGEFVRPNIKDYADTPRMGSFEEATFAIPLKQKVRNTAYKYTTLSNLIVQKEGVDFELANSKEFIEDLDETLKAATKRISKLDDKRKKHEKKIEKARLEVKNSETNISRQEGIIERAERDIKIFENYIKVANSNIEKIMQDKKNEMNDNRQNIIELSEDKQDREDEYSKKISLIKKIKEKEKRRIKDAGRRILIAKKTIEEDDKKIAKAKTVIEEGKLTGNQLKKERSVLSAQIENSMNQNLSRELSLNIHKRISPSFACLTLILIGIPLGIMARSGSMLVSLGISFIVTLFFYYPLIATGIILADSFMFPIIPSLWGANGFNFILGLVLFRNIFSK